MSLDLSSISSITVSIAQTRAEVKQAIEFCSSVYERNYGTHWTVPPDLFFVAKENGEIVATGGLTFASRHPQIASERYFCLSDGMRLFIDGNRQRVGEFGRFASTKIQAAKAILHSVLDYCTISSVDFLFAWANPSVYKHTTDRLGLHFWPIPVRLNLDGAMNDWRWASPPAGFFQRKQPPALHLGIVPFWENTKRALAEECGAAVSRDELEATTSIAVRAAAARTKPYVHTTPRLLRAGPKSGGASPDRVFPNLSSVSSDPEADAKHKVPGTE